MLNLSAAIHFGFNVGPNTNVAWNSCPETSLGYLLMYRPCLCSLERLVINTQDILKDYMSKEDLKKWTYDWSKPLYCYLNQYQPHPYKLIHEAKQNSNTEVKPKFPCEIIYGNINFRLEREYSDTGKYRCKGSKGNCMKSCRTVLVMNDKLEPLYIPQHISN